MFFWAFLISLGFFLISLLIIALLLFKIKKLKREPQMDMDCAMMLNRLNTKGGSLVKITWVDDANLMKMSPRMR